MTSFLMVMTRWVILVTAVATVAWAVRSPLVSIVRMCSTERRRFKPLAEVCDLNHRRGSPAVLILNGLSSCKASVVFFQVSNLVGLAEVACK